MEPQYLRPKGWRPVNWALAGLAALTALTALPFLGFVVLAAVAL